MCCYPYMYSIFSAEKQLFSYLCLSKRYVYRKIVSFSDSGYIFVCYTRRHISHSTMSSCSVGNTEKRLRYRFVIREVVYLRDKLYVHYIRRQIYYCKYRRYSATQLQMFDTETAKLYTWRRFFVLVRLPVFNLFNL